MGAAAITLLHKPIRQSADPFPPGKEDTMANIAVVYQSGQGHTKQLAEGVVRGVHQVPGVTSESFRISGSAVHEGRFGDPALMGRLDESDAIVFGCTTYMGSCSAIYKAFLEAAFQPHWLEQRWKDKIAAGFTNSASQNGDKASTLYQLVTFAMQMGMIWVGVGDLPGNNWSGGTRGDLNRLGSWIGAMGQSNADEDAPSRGDLDTAERFGNRIALISRRLKDGVPFHTERWNEPEFRAQNVLRSKDSK
jgi:multimeric flavodoxin WrbA